MSEEFYDPALLTTLLGIAVKAVSTGILLAALWSMVFRIKTNQR